MGTHNKCLSEALVMSSHNINALSGMMDFTFCEIQMVHTNEKMSLSICIEGQIQPAGLYSFNRASVVLLSLLDMV